MGNSPSNSLHHFGLAEFSNATDRTMSKGTRALLKANLIRLEDPLKKGTTLERVIRAYEGKLGINNPQFNHLNELNHTNVEPSITSPMINNDIIVEEQIDLNVDVEEKMEKLTIQLNVVTPKGTSAPLSSPGKRKPRVIAAAVGSTRPIKSPKSSVATKLTLRETLSSSLIKLPPVRRSMSKEKPLISPDSPISPCLDSPRSSCHTECPSPVRYPTLVSGAGSLFEKSPRLSQTPMISPPGLSHMRIHSNGSFSSSPISVAAPPSIIPSTHLKRSSFSSSFKRNSISAESTNLNDVKVSINKEKSEVPPIVNESFKLNAKISIAAATSHASFTRNPPPRSVPKERSKEEMLNNLMKLTQEINSIKKSQNLIKEDEEHSEDEREIAAIPPPSTIRPFSQKPLESPPKKDFIKDMFDNVIFGTLLDDSSNARRRAVIANAIPKLSREVSTYEYDPYLDNSNDTVNEQDLPEDTLDISKYLILVDIYLKNSIMESKGATDSVKRFFEQLISPEKDVAKPPNKRPSSVDYIISAVGVTPLPQVPSNNKVILYDDELGGIWKLLKWEAVEPYLPPLMCCGRDMIQSEIKNDENGAKKSEDTTVKSTEKLDINSEEKSNAATLYTSYCDQIVYPKLARRNLRLRNVQVSSVPTYGKINDLGLYQNTGLDAVQNAKVKLALSKPLKNSLNFARKIINQYALSNQPLHEIRDFDGI